MSESVDRELGKLSQQIENTADNLVDVKNYLSKLFDNVDDDYKEIIKGIAKYEVHQNEQDERLKELKKLANANKEGVQKEREERLTFETETKTGVRFTKYTALILGALATLLGAFATVVSLMR